MTLAAHLIVDRGGFRLDIELRIEPGEVVALRDRFLGGGSPQA